MLPIRLLLAALMAALPALAASADPLRNTSQFGVGMRAGPGLQFPLIHVLDPGEVADRGRCDLDGKWCLLTARDKIGWVDTTGLVPPRSELSRSDPLRPPDTPGVQSSILGDTAIRPLPGVITDAVRRSTDGRPLPPPPPGARVPVIFATDAPFNNLMDVPVNLRAGPGTDTPVVGTLAPGQGGTIDVCDATQQWCRMAVRDGPVAWVKMTFVGLRRHEVAPIAPGDTAAR